MQALRKLSLLPSLVGFPTSVTHWLKDEERERSITISDNLKAHNKICEKAMVMALLFTQNEQMLLLLSFHHMCIACWPITRIKSKTGPPFIFLTHYLTESQCWTATNVLSLFVGAKNAGSRNIVTVPITIWNPKWCCQSSPLQRSKKMMLSHNILISAFPQYKMAQEGRFD